MIKKDEIILSCDDISKSYENGNSRTNVLKYVSIRQKEFVGMDLDVLSGMVA